MSRHLQSLFYSCQWVDSLTPKPQPFLLPPGERRRMGRAALSTLFHIFSHFLSTATMCRQILEHVMCTTHLAKPDDPNRMTLS
jgi:hypothetical protein